ncbi:hypothetical protein BH23GEM1_BH23GEM1_12140 [soil metagenome]
MPYRTFADEEGKDWEVWDVRPGRVERRGTDRRDEQSAPWTGVERRMKPDRRQRVESRLTIAQPLAEGWLVFRSGEEKRRLAPIPANWESSPWRELRDLCARADVIVARLDEKSA